MMSKELEIAIETDNWNYIEYTIDFEKNLTNLEEALHNAEDPEFIAKNSLIVGAEFYDADWCGIVEADLNMEAWEPLWWYNRETQDLSVKRFFELEDTAPLSRWVNALYNNEAVIILDTGVLKEENPEEYAVYERLGVHSILAVPYWKNPTGFLIVRNPKKHINHSSYLQMLAYVVFTSLVHKRLLQRRSKAFSPKNIKNDNDILINLFGNLEIYTSEGIISEDELNSPKISRMLTYLLFHRKHPQQARTIYESIWTDELDDNANTKIRSLVYRLQSAFSIISDKRLIISTNLGYQLNPDLNIMTDVDIFDQLIAQSRSALSYQAKIELLKRAVDLYKGSVLSTAGGEEWLETIALTYKYKYLGSNNELLKLYYETNNYPLVLQYANKAIETDDSNVEAYYWIIRTLNETGSEEMAKSMMRIAKQFLMKDELADLNDMLNLKK